MGKRFLIGGAALIVAVAVTGCTGDDEAPSSDTDSPTATVDGPTLESEQGDGGSDGSSPGTLVVGGGDPADGSDPAAPDGQAPDISLMPPPEDGSPPTSAGSGANPPDVSTQPSG